MPEIDVGLALHCLEDLGQRSCPIVTERTEALRPSEACAGLSIRDTLFLMLIETVEESMEPKYRKSKHGVTLGKLQGQMQAFAYSIALMDNPYRPDWAKVLVAARVEVDAG